MIILQAMALGIGLGLGLTLGIFVWCLVGYWVDVFEWRHR